MHVDILEQKVDILHRDTHTHTHTLSQVAQVRLRSEPFDA